MERKLQQFSQGMEHDVFLHDNGRREVIKVPRRFNKWSFLFTSSTNTIRKELRDAQELVKGTRVEIPVTQVYRVRSPISPTVFPDSYAIRQQYIEEDESVPNILEHLEAQGLDTLVDECKHAPGNFVSNGGTVFWINPTRGTIGRMLERFTPIRVETYRKLRVKASPIIRLVGL